LLAEGVFTDVRPVSGQAQPPVSRRSAPQRAGVQQRAGGRGDLGRRRDDLAELHLAVADFFGVPAAYFFDDDVAGRVNQQLELLKAEQARLTELAGSSDVQLMAMRAGELSAKGRKQVMDLLDVVYQLEQTKRGPH
jgi:hypothetical protein